MELRGIDGVSAHLHTIECKMVLYALQSGKNASSVHICRVHLVDVALGLGAELEVHMYHDHRVVARLAGLF